MRFLEINFYVFLWTVFCILGCKLIRFGDAASDYRSAGWLNAGWSGKYSPAAWIKKVLFPHPPEHGKFSLLTFPFTWIIWFLLKGYVYLALMFPVTFYMMGAIILDAAAECMPKKKCPIPS